MERELDAELRFHFESVDDEVKFAETSTKSALRTELF